MKYILTMFTKYFLTPNQWVWLALLFASHSVFPAEILSLKLLSIKEVPKASHPANELQTDKNNKPLMKPTSGNLVKKSTGMRPHYIDFNSIPDSITQEDNNRKSPSISSIPDIKDDELPDPDIGDIPDSIAEEAPDITAPHIRSISDNTTRGSTIATTSQSEDASDKIQKPESTPLKSSSIYMLINLEQLKAETQNIAQKFKQLIIDNDIEGYRGLLNQTLTEKSPLQVLVIFHIIKIQRNTLLHWMATAHSKEFRQELKYMLEAFGAYNERSQESLSNSLWEMRQEIALKELDRDSLWKSKSVMDLNNFKPVVLLRNNKIKSFYRSLKRELLTPGNTRRFLSAITGKTGEDLFDLLKRIKISLHSDKDFIEETRQFVTLLTPPLYIKNPQGLTPLQRAISTSTKRKASTVAILSEAEKIIGIDTNTDSPLHNKRRLLLRRIGIGTAIALGITSCAYVFH